MESVVLTTYSVQISIYLPTYGWYAMNYNFMHYEVFLHSKVEFLDHVGLWGGRDDDNGFVGNVGQRHVVRAVVHLS